MSRTLIVVTLVFLVLEILPGVNGSHLLPRALVEHEQHLAKRNLSTFLNEIPTECVVVCDVPVGAARGCFHLDCACTVENSNALVKCVNCVVDLTPYADGVVDKYQLILDEWKNSYCAQFYTPPMKVGVPVFTSSTTPTATPTPNSSKSICISAALWAMTVINLSLLLLR